MRTLIAGDDGDTGQLTVKGLRQAGYAVDLAG